MGDVIREWGLAILALLGAIFTPVAYVMNIRADIRVMKTEMDAENRTLRAEMAALRAENAEIKEWCLRVEAKLDRVLFGKRQE